MVKSYLYLLVIFVGFSFADGISSLENFLYTKNNSITSEFTQTIFNSKKNQISHGVMKLHRPNKFKWLYDNNGNNSGQQLISDGKVIYIIDNELEQVTIKKIGNTLDKSPASILAGSNNIKKYYNISNKPNNNGMEWVLLVPKVKNDNNGFESLMIGFNQKTHILEQMKFVSSLGGKSLLSFTNLRSGVKFKADEFTYKAPKTYDIIKN